MNIEDLNEAFVKHKDSEAFKNYERNRKLFEGKSASVFYKDVLKRVKLEFMGVITPEDKYIEIARHATGKGYQVCLKPFEPLVVGNNILEAVTRLYSEFGSNSEPTITIDEDKKGILSEIDLQEKTEEALSIQSYGGKFLLKGIVQEKKFYFSIIPPAQYFEIPNNFTGISDGYVIYNQKKEIITTEIYSYGKTEYRKFEITAGKLKEIQFDYDLEQFGAVKDGLGYIINYDGWQVAEVKNIFNRSDYTDDLVIFNRELVIGDTLTSQAFDKVANPLLQIPESALEYDEQGQLRINIQDRLFVVNPEDKELKQVALETKTAEWNLHRTNILNQIYQDTGTNEQAFGLNKNGIAASGEAKKRDLERTLSTVLAKRDKVFVGFEKVIKWGYRTIHNSELQITITGKDLLTLSLGEKMQIVVQGISTGVLSLESAVRFLNMTNVSVEEEIEKIKSDLGYRKKLIEVLQVLNQIDTENRVAGIIQKQLDETLKELDLDEEE